MPLSKKPKMPKSAEKRNTPPSPAPSDREQTNGRSAASGAARSQIEAFESANRLFRAGRFQEAREAFREATSGANRSIAHNAELHIRICDRRLEQTTEIPSARTAEEHYNYGVALINSRELGSARKHLEAALAQDSQAEHVYYALALCLGLAGDLAGAYENLKRAIELQPRNRLAARQDADFAGIVDRPPLDRLVYPERYSTGI